MNTIKIDGLVGGYPEPIDGTSEWYYSQKGTDDFLDLYEAEEIVKDGHAFGGMNCHLIHFPDARYLVLLNLRKIFMLRLLCGMMESFIFYALIFLKRQFKYIVIIQKIKNLSLLINCHLIV